MNTQHIKQQNPGYEHGEENCVNEIFDFLRIWGIAQFA